MGRGVCSVFGVSCVCAGSLHFLGDDACDESLRMDEERAKDSLKLEG